MKKLAFAVVMSVVAGSASADWWSNGNVVTHTNVGAGGGDISAFNVDSLTTTFGLQASYSASGIGPASLADDYTPSENVRVDALRVAWYISNNAAPTLDAAYVRIYAGDPMAGGTIVYGDMVTSRLVGSEALMNDGRSVYRTSGSTGAAATSSTRKLQSATIGTGGFEMTGGTTYYVAWSLNSPNGTSVFCPSLGRRGNGRQELTSNGSPTWTEALGTATNPNSDVDLAFELDVTPVPEPGTMIAVGVGLVALIARRRKA